MHLSAELPCGGSNRRVLYPASAKAGSDLQVIEQQLHFVHQSCTLHIWACTASDDVSSTLQMGLAARGIDVMRLNTYTTRQVSSISDDALRLARQARVLAIASPSAIKCALVSLQQ